MLKQYFTISTNSIVCTIKIFYHNININIKHIINPNLKAEGGRLWLSGLREAPNNVLCDSTGVHGLFVSTHRTDVLASATISALVVPLAK